MLEVTRNALDFPNGTFKENVRNNEELNSSFKSKY